MTEKSRGQVDTSAAEVYERFFLPALFEQWPPHVIRRSGMTAGDRVLDVACGTGVLARAAEKQVGRAGAVVGLDPNDAMLAVAARKAPEIEWRKGRAESLPFDDASFDCVVSEFGLMFFEDRRAAVAEMLRVLRPGKRAVVAVWASIDESPGYAALARLLAQTVRQGGRPRARSALLPGRSSALARHFRARGRNGAGHRNRGGRVPTFLRSTAGSRPKSRAGRSRGGSPTKRSSDSSAKRGAHFPNTFVRMGASPSTPRRSSSR